MLEIGKGLFVSKFIRHQNSVCEKLGNSMNIRKVGMPFWCLEPSQPQGIHNREMLRKAADVSEKLTIGISQHQGLWAFGKTKEVVI